MTPAQLNTLVGIHAAVNEPDEDKREEMLAPFTGTKRTMSTASADALMVQLGQMSF